MAEMTKENAPVVEVAGGEVGTVKLMVIGVQYDRTEAKDGKPERHYVTLHCAKFVDNDRGLWCEKHRVPIEVAAEFMVRHWQGPGLYECMAGVQQFGMNERFTLMGIPQFRGLFKPDDVWRWGPGSPVTTGGSVKTPKGANK